MCERVQLSTASTGPTAPDCYDHAPPRPRRLPPEARSGQDAGAVRVAAPPRPADLRRPASRRAPAPLRLPPRARRGARELGGPERRAARGGSALARRPRRGPPARLRDLRGGDPAGPVRGGDGRDLGPRHVRARRGEEGRRADRPPRRRAPPGDVDARAREARRRPEELAADPQAQRRRRRAGAGSVRADARHAGDGRPEGGGLAVRGQVGRLPGDRVRPRRRGTARQP